MRSCCRRIIVLLWIAILVALSSVADPLDSWVQLSPLPTEFNLQTVVHAEGLFLAGGQVGTIVGSFDGVNWTAHPVDPTFASVPHINGMAYGNGQFVAVGSQGAILTSADGFRWTQQWSGVKDHLLGVTCGGGQYVVVGGGRSDGPSQVILRSPDGVRWTVQQVSPGQPVLWRVFFAQDRFVAAGNYGTLLTSRNGVTWTSVTSGFRDRLSGIAYGNGRIVVVGRLGQVLTSTNGLNWTTNRVAGQPEFFDVAFGNGQFAAIGDDSYLWNSTNGIAWTRKEVGISGVNSAITYGAGQFAAVGSSGAIMTSLDGDHWEKRSSGTSALLYRVAAGNGQMVVVGDSSIQIAPRSFQMTEPLLSSADGITWQVPVSPLEYGVSSVSFVGGRFVAFGRRNAAPSRGVALISTNGTAWQIREMNTSSLPLRVTSGNGLYVGAGGGLFHSTDGLNWMQDNPPILNSVIALAYGNERYVAFDGQGRLYTSTNGTNWVIGDIASRLTGLAFGDGKFVAVGIGDTGGKQVGRILTSTDGVDWTEQVVPAAWDGQAHILSGIAYGGGWFVAVGERSTVLVSQDGINWTPTKLGLVTSLEDVAYDNGRFVAVGGNGVVVQSGNVLATTLTNPVLAGNSVSFTLTGPVGQIHRIQSTADLSLSQWTDLAVVTNFTGRVVFTDPTRVPRRFYRAFTDQ